MCVKQAVYYDGTWNTFFPAAVFLIYPRSFIRNQWTKPDNGSEDDLDTAGSDFTLPAVWEFDCAQNILQHSQSVHS